MKTISGSFIESMEETQELLEFWVEKKLASMIEIVKMDYAKTRHSREEKERREVPVCA